MSLLTYHDHPGGILKRMYLEPLGMSSGALAKALGVPRSRMERFVKEEVAVTPDTALRLGRYWGTSAEMWMNMQAAYDLAKAKEDVDVSSIEPREREPVEEREHEDA